MLKSSKSIYCIAVFILVGAFFGSSQGSDDFRRPPSLSDTSSDSPFGDIDHCLDEIIDLEEGCHTLESDPYFLGIDEINLAASLELRTLDPHFSDQTDPPGYDIDESDGNGEIAAAKELVPTLIIKKYWKLEEDEALLAAVAKEKSAGKISWANVAREMRTRSRTQCREHYLHVLDPSLDKGKWTEENQIRLNQAYNKFGSKWAKIRKVEFPKRSENFLKNKWHLDCNKRLTEQKRALPNFGSDSDIEKKKCKIQKEH